jgi:hypothetical protein
MIPDCPSNFWEATTTYVSATPGFECRQCPLTDSLRTHIDAPHKVVRIYMPSQELFADVAIKILDILIPGTAGERVFAKFWRMGPSWSAAAGSSSGRTHRVQAEAELRRLRNIC